MAESRTVFVLTIGPDPARRVEIGDGTSLSVGRGASNDLQLAHRSIKLLHCRFENKQGVLRLVPVAGAPLAVDTRLVRSPTVLAGGETVWIGGIALRVSREGIGSAVPGRAGPHAEAGLVGDSVAPRSRARRVVETLAGRGRWFVISGVVHLLLGLWLASLPFRRDLPVEQGAIQVGILPDARRPSETPPLSDLQDPPVDVASVRMPRELLDPPSAAEESPLRPQERASRHQELIGLGRGGALRPGLRRAGRAGIGEEFSRMLADLRGRGLDVVLVIDTTMSMEGVLEGVKGTMGALVGLLSQLVGNLRIGIVAYTDQGERDPTRSLDLTRDAYRILNFMSDLRAEGGGDFEEAVDVGLRRAVRDMGWRPAARKVILVVGDAPPRVERIDVMRREVTRFAANAGRRRDCGVVSTLFVVSEDRFTQRFRDRIAAAFRDLAKCGGGDYAELEGESVSERDLLDLVFGAEHREEVDHFVRSAGRDRRGRIVRQHVRAADRTWLLDRLEEGYTHPAVVDGLIALADRTVLHRVAFLLERLDRPPATRWAALYILKRALGVALPYDPEKPAWAQAEAFRKILSLVGRFS